jgi:M-phase inducer tyrosine phosphatase
MSDISRQKSTWSVSFALGIPLPELDDAPPMAVNTARRRCTDAVSPTSASNTHGHLPTTRHKGKIPHITGDTLCQLIGGGYSESFAQVVIVDARFAYEYEGGHIHDAINVTDPNELKSLFFKDVIPRAVFVFHCEFSQVRGPSLVGFFREIDRSMNVYPKLHYPNVYILDGGYSEFYHAFPECCLGGYVRMFDQKARENGELLRANAVFKDRVAAAKTQLKGEKADENAVQRKVDPVSPKIPRRRFASCVDD